MKLGSCLVARVLVLRRARAAGPEARLTKHIRDGLALAWAIHDNANEPQIMPLSCVDARKSAHRAAPVWCGPNETLPQLRGCIGPRS